MLTVIALLLSYFAPSYNKIDNVDAPAKVEYSPKALSDQNILLTCRELSFDTVLFCDFEKKTVSALIFKNGYNDNNNYKTNKTVNISSETIIALCDNAGGVNTSVFSDEYGFSKGNWRLTGEQFFELLSVCGEAQKECLVSDFFSNVFNEGLKNEQISVILEYSSEDINYLYLHDFARQIGNGLENTVVSFE